MDRLSHCVVLLFFSLFQQYVEVPLLLFVLFLLLWGSAGQRSRDDGDFHRGLFREEAPRGELLLASKLRRNIRSQITAVC